MELDLKNTDVFTYIDKVRALISGRQHYVYIHTFGCQQNEADSERIRGLAVAMGYEVTDDEALADLILINTCAIREHAEMKALSFLGRFKQYKEKNPELIIGIMGCMSAEGQVIEEIRKRYRYVSFSAAPHMISRLPELVYTYIKEGTRVLGIDEDRGDVVENIPLVRLDKYRAWVNIMHGCNNFCTYCIVPYVRGRERSRSSARVISECEALIRDGVREITLLGQNVNSYRSDISFAELLSRIAAIDGDFILRFMTSHPKDVPDELIEVMAANRSKIAPTFHLPLQSGSDRILRLMNRTYNREKYLDTVRRIRERIPEVALTTDIIVGFPGESEEDFLDTMDILQNVRFDMAYSFLYSPREGTRAARMEEQIPREIMDERMARLLLLQRAISLEKNTEYIGKTVRALVEGPSKRVKTVWTARSEAGKAVHFESDEDLTGKFIEFEIERAGGFDLYGKIKRERYNENDENNRAGS